MARVKGLALCHHRTHTHTDTQVSRTHEKSKGMRRLQRRL